MSTRRSLFSGAIGAAILSAFGLTTDAGAAKRQMGGRALRRRKRNRRRSALRGYKRCQRVEGKPCGKRLPCCDLICFAGTHTCEKFALPPQGWHPGKPLPR